MRSQALLYSTHYSRKHEFELEMRVLFGLACTKNLRLDKLNAQEIYLKDNLNSHKLFEVVSHLSGLVLD